MTTTTSTTGTTSTTRRRVRSAVLLALLASVLFAPSAQRADASEGGSAHATIAIHHAAGAIDPEVTTPPGWDCSVPEPEGFVQKVSCAPLAAGTWTCPSPYVQVSYLGSPGDTIHGTSGCGGATVTCSPSQLIVANWCEDHRAGPKPLPAFTCVANYVGATPATEWDIVCRTHA